MGYDLERQIGFGFTGANSRSGDLLQVKFNHRDTDNTKYATQVYITLHTDNILEIRDYGVNVFD